MITLKEWFRKYHNRPLRIAAAFLVAIWFVFAERSYVAISEKHSSAVNQTADLLSMATQSKDRVMIETLLETLMSQGGAESAALCIGNRQIIGANQDLFGCKDVATIFIRTLDKRIPGSGELFLRARFNLLVSLSSIFSILGFGLTLVLAGFYFIRVAQDRIEKDILGPLLNELLSDEPLEINELHDLKCRVKQVQELEAQKAVTLAIQENNEQVAHDIRSPVSSIAELVGRAEFKDNELKAALEKALARAKAVASELLTGEKKKDEPATEFLCDFTSLVNDIAIEKRPLFSGGEIEVVAPKHLYALSRLTEGSLQRVLSNLIDNAMLACEKKKWIRISVTRQENSILLTVEDVGRGIPAEVAGKLGTKGVSLRENSQPRGSGRGVYAAMKTLGEIGGRIEFQSAAGIGTTVSIVVPIKAIESADHADLVLVDNEATIRMAWTVLAAREGKQCKAFASIDELLAAADSISRGTPIYLDSDLGNGKKGQDFAPLLRELGFQLIVLTTAHEKLHGTEMPYIDKVTGKKFPNRENKIVAEARRPEARS